MTRLSRLLAPTLREDPADAEVVSHKLLVRAGPPTQYWPTSILRTAGVGANVASSASSASRPKEISHR